MSIRVERGAVLDVLDALAETFRNSGEFAAYHHVRAVAHGYNLHLTSCVGGKRDHGGDEADPQPRGGEPGDFPEPSRAAWDAARDRYPDTAYNGDPSDLSLVRTAFVEGYAARDALEQS